MKLKHFPNGLQPPGQTSWGQTRWICIFALIGAPGRTAVGKASGGPRMVGHSQGEGQGHSSLWNPSPWGFTHLLGFYQRTHSGLLPHPLTHPLLHITRFILIGNYLSSLLLKQEWRTKLQKFKAQNICLLFPFMTQLYTFVSTQGIPPSLISPAPHSVLPCPPLLKLSWLESPSCGHPQNRGGGSCLTTYVKRITSPLKLHKPSSFVFYSTSQSGFSPTLGKFSEWPCFVLPLLPTPEHPMFPPWNFFYPFFPGFPAQSPGSGIFCRAHSQVMFSSLHSSLWLYFGPKLLITSICSPKNHFKLSMLKIA